MKRLFLRHFLSGSPLSKRVKNLYFNRMDHSFALDIIVFAVIAAVLFFRLRKVLGERQEGEPPPIDAELLMRVKNAAQNASPDKTGAITVEPSTSWAQEMPNYQWVANATAHHRLLPLAAVDPSFHPASFLQGARRAYEIIVIAFAKGDLATLESLLTPDLYKTFSEQVIHRQTEGQQQELLLQTMNQAIISDAELNGTQAYVSVDFTTEQNITLRDRQGAIVDGLDGSKQILQERWVFTNDLKDDETLWRLAETDVLDD